MRLAILGGTGDIGEGLCLRWAYDSDHELVIGSRDPERARGKAEEYEVELESRGRERTVTGFVNEMAADRGDVVVLAVPAAHIAETLESVAHRLDDDTILISPAVAMEADETGLHYAPPPQGSVAALVAEHAPDPNPVVGAFHTLSADRLANLDLTFEMDTPVVGDDTDAVDIVRSLAEDIDGFRALSAGPLAHAPEVESLTALLANLGRYNASHDLGVRFG